MKLNKFKLFKTIGLFSTIAATAATIPTVIFLLQKKDKADNDRENKGDVDHQSSIAKSKCSLTKFKELIKNNNLEFLFKAVKLQTSDINGNCDAQQWLYTNLKVKSVEDQNTFFNVIEKRKSTLDKELFTIVNNVKLTIQGGK